MLNRSNRWAIRNRFLGTAILAAAVIGCAVSAAPALADPTLAGTQIANTASLSFLDGGAPLHISSNTVTLGVDVLLDVVLEAEQASIRPSGDAVTPVGFVLTNGGNADETFALTATNDPASTAIVGIATDSDGDGVYSAADTMLTGTSVTLAPNEHRRLFVLARRGAGGQDATVSLTAASTTGSGDAGTVFAGAGVGGADAIVGHTGGRATAHTLLTTQATGPRLEKSQSVRAQDGSDHAGHGSIITYRLDAHFPGATAAVELRDAIPAGTVFVPGSMMLDGKPLTDAADGDPASFDGSAVRIVLGDVTVTSVRTVTFETKIL
ncbi:hypothetical protein Q4F19_15535 [Sphingomonas sp. BIUV-7]|uniref:DUF11 domain-containing protein n=1 Tax=Sphingomonas natans TaxID=3063330 RepID=A0ABT8YBT3_9SPHN|nr:hypothetical protein [Sphingomonas sp. BIUV-7]MDO6415803.1 hypothetical protein [Sphingomonas sp. BIUV-7]